MKKYVKPLIGAIGAGGIVAAGIALAINLNVGDVKITATVEYSPEPAKVEVIEGLSDVEYGQGEIKVDGEEVPTVEAVESTGPVTEVNNTNCPEGEECGRGAVVPNLDVSSPQVFANQVIGACIDVDGYYGAQCWDEMAAYFINYVGRTLSTCGTGAAKGTIADGCWQGNAGNEFTMIWNPTEIQPGDIAVYSTGTWGHIGMAMGYYNNGYFTLLGQNQGGAPCPGGGAAGNIINLSTRDFIGAFRPNIYIPPEPEPDPEPEPTPIVPDCSKIEVVAGDTLGDIMLRCEGEVKWGAEMDAYAQSWISEATGESVFYGWTHGTGYGLLAGDTIIRK